MTPGPPSGWRDASGAANLRPVIDRLPDLELFTRIVEAGSLSAAARGLGTTQPTVSKRLAAMERSLGARLLQRSTRRVTLTEEGQLWYDACRRWLGELREVTERLGSRASLRGTLRVNAPVSFGRYVVAPLVLRFLEQQPTAQVDLTLTDRRVDLVEDNVDVAVRIGQVANPQVVARPLISYRTRLVAAPAWLRANGPITSVQDLRRHPLVLYGPPWEESVDGPGGTVRLSADRRFRTTDGEACAAAVRAGFGLGLSSPWLLESSLADGSLVEVLRGAWGERFSVHAIYLPSRVLPARVRAFVTFLQRELPRATTHLPSVTAP